MDIELILIRYGELSLKSTFVRRQFESALVRNINQVFSSTSTPCTVHKEWGRIYLYTTEIQKAVELLKKIFGITSVSPAIQTTDDIRDISHQAVQIAKEKIKKDKSFALRVTRTGTHGFTSQDVAKQVGDDTRKTTGACVDLTNPDVELFIEIRNRKSFLFLEKIRGVGGLPFGTQGNVVAIIDTRESLLAAWYLMRRGCKAIFVTPDEHLSSTIRSFLGKWYIDSHVVIVLEKGNLYSGIRDILTQKNAFALVTGHTLYSHEALNNISSLKNSLGYPVLSPLLAMDDKEIKKKCVEVGISL